MELPEDQFGLHEGSWGLFAAPLFFAKSIKKSIFLQGGKAKSARFRCRSTRTSRAKCWFFKKVSYCRRFRPRAQIDWVSPPSSTADFWKGFAQKLLFSLDGSSIFGLSEKRPTTHYLLCISWLLSPFSLLASGPHGLRAP